MANVLKVPTVLVANLVFIVMVRFMISD